MHGEDEGFVEIDLDLELYLKGREDPVFAQMEIDLPLDIVEELGVSDLMEHCLSDFVEQINRRSSPFIVVRSRNGMRQIFWHESIQGVTLHAPSAEKVERLIQEAIDNG